MWWLDPGKEVLNILFNRVLAPYVENLDLNQVNYGIGQGQLTLRKLRLKKGALDKFRLPVDVIEGHLGKFTLSLHWMNLGNQPVEVLIEDVYLLVVPSSESTYDAEEEERRAQAAKFERLENAELLHIQGQAEQDSPQQQGLLSSLITKVINNLQVTVKNIHIRYEDKLSVPGHPFAAGVTLAGFTAVSVNDSWLPAFIDSTAGVIHKLAKMESLAVYFDTDATSLAGLSYDEFVKKFMELINHGEKSPNHQFILKPVSGEGRVKINNKSTKDVPRFDVQLLFDEIGVLLDDNQYRDAISLVDMYHFYTRQHQYHKFRPAIEEFEKSRPRALWKFAATAILDEVHQKHREWTWDYFKERRDDRHRYVELFKNKQLGPLSPTDTTALEALERKLSYEDLRFYRSIARSQLKKDLAARRKLEEEKKKQQTQSRSSWTGWLWGSSGSGTSQTATEESPFSGEMTEEQRKQLYEILDYDEKAALASSFETPRDALKLRATASLQRGSFALKADPHGRDTEILSVLFDRFQAEFIQRPDNFETSLSLTSFSVHDGTTKDTVYPRIVQVQGEQDVVRTADVDTSVQPVDPFFYLKFENNPLDERADSALTVRMRNMEIVYHRGYVEAIYKFFKPPASQLESVEALLDAAGETLEGIRRETRAGLEYALETHKTVDIHMDLNAPIIIIPEDITTKNCKHLIVDAGHIAIESELANKKAVQEISSKRKQQYSDEDYRRLESFMYDKLTVRLEAAQFVIGTDLEASRKALTSDDHDALHLLERINIDLQVQNSIVPSAHSLARFKVSGHLPNLQINLSDTKYKSLMRLIDVSIPKFDDDTAAPARPRPSLEKAKSGAGAFRLPGGIFGSQDPDYGLESDVEEEKKSDDAADADADEFFEAQSGAVESPEMLQHVVEVDFRVDNLCAALYKTHDGVERELGNVKLEQFAMSFAMAKYTMAVDLRLRSLSMHVVQDGKEPINFISSSSAGSSEHLLTVKYNRVQPQSPQFVTVYEGVDQSVDIMITTVVVRAAPEPVIALYDFIMTTFVPQDSAPAAATSPQLDQDPAEAFEAPSTQKIKVLVKLAGVQVIVINEDIQVATLAMSTGDASIVLHASTMQVNCRLGSLSLTDDSQLRTALPEYKQILSIEGDNFADFRYQTFDPADKETYKGIKSSVYLATGSLRVHYLEEPLHQLYIFLIRLAKLKGLYDAATQAAAQSVAEIERMQFNVSIKSPIVVFPTDPERSSDNLVLRLGELNAHNSYEGLTDKISASLRGISLSSTLTSDGNAHTLKMVENIDATADVTQNTGIDRSTDLNQPETAVVVTISDVKLHLTQAQYGLLMQLSKSIPRVLAVPATEIPEERSIPETNQQAVVPSSDSAADLQPEVRVDRPGSKIWPTLDLLVTLDVVKLHLYDEFASSEHSLKDHGIARMALNSCVLRAKMLSDGAAEAELILKSFTMSNTRPGNTKFREIIPAAHHNRNQVMILFTSTGGPDSSSIAVVTVDSPQVIFAVDPIIGLLEFFTSALDTESSESQEGSEEQDDAGPVTAQQPSAINFRLDLHDVSVSVLENDTDVNTRAIRLGIRKLFLSQQGILALSVEQLGMSLTHMGKDADTVRFLDDVDFTFSLDSRSTDTHQTMSIEMTSQPVVFRASYRDINLITTIVNRALELYTESAKKHAKPPATQSDALVVASTYGVSTSRKTARATSRSRPIGTADVLISKEQLRLSCEGFRLILIGDLHEQPMLHLKVKPFVATAKDWSAELQASTTLAVHISYWNLTNSHWEPLIDPWTFTAAVTKDSTSGGIVASLSAKERLDLNLSMTFVELALATAKMFGQEGERVLRKARGSYAPYRIRNRTGCSIFVWADTDGSAATVDSAMTEIPHDKTIDWRFDDWKTMREHVSSTTHNSIGVQFIGKQWEQIRSIPVDREGEFSFTLRPRTDKLAYRIVCDVAVQDNVKVVTIRSTYRVENLTLYPLEITLVDEMGRPVHALEKIAPGKDYALPIEGIGQNRLKIQPDQGFGYKPSPAIRWEDLISRRSFTIRCPHTDPHEAAFRFQAWVDTDVKEAVTRKYPKICLKLRAPIELENLLPYNIEYRIYDKNTDQNWRSYLRKGGVMPVHSVELAHMVLLNVTVQDTVFKPSEFSIINTDGSTDFDIENRLTLRDEKNRKLNLGLNYVRYPDSGGSFKVQIYCPYLVVNKTGLPFSVRPWRTNRLGSSQDIAGDLRPEALQQPTPFMLSHPTAHGKDFSFKIGESLWSQAVGFEAPAAETRLVIPSESRNNEEIHIGLSWTEGLGKYKLTKVITLAPRFILRNNTSDAICYREHGATPRDRGVLEPGERTPLHFMRKGDAKLLTLAFSGINAQWSAPINLEDIGRVHFRLANPTDGRVHLMRTEVKIGGSTIFVTVSKAEEWPFVIENDSDYAFTVYQTDLDHPEVPAGNRTVPSYKLGSKSTLNYAWDFPASREKKLVLDVFGAGARRALDILEIGALVPFKFATGQGPRIVSLDVRAEGSKQILRISNYNPQVSLYKPTCRRTGSVTQLDTATLTGSQEGFEAVQEEVSFSLAVKVDFEGIGLSLVNRKAVEVVYMSVNDLKFEYNNSPVAQAVNLVCGNLQIDNQLHDALFPVVLQPTPVPKDSSTVASLPTLQASIIWLKDEAHGVTFIKYCSILVQALTVQADEDFLYSLFDLTKIKGAPWDEAQEDILITQPNDIVEPADTAEGQELYFEVLELQPIKLSISFMRTERVSSEEQLAIRNPFAVVLNAITMAVGNINEAPLEMNALAIKDMRLRLPELQERIMYHYRQEVLRQLYRILGSADFIGNPVGLFTNVSSGVADIFYEPFNGAVMHGNQELGIGIAKGAASFVKKTVFGVSDSFTKFTSSVGKGLSAATFDSEYQMRRRMTQRRNRPRHAIYGVAAGAEAFANSLASGVEGVLMKPIEGAENDGARGFFKGIGKGLVGAVTKPVIGVFDLASNVGEGIRNTTTVFDNPARDRVRLPRLVPADGVLVPFSQREALGQYWMRDLDNGAYRKELYVAHINLPGGDNVVLLTTSRVISFASNRLTVDWQLPFSQVQGVTIEDTGIRFAHKGGKEHDRFVYIPDKASQTWFFGQVASVVRAFNAQRRMDS